MQTPLRYARWLLGHAPMTARLVFVCGLLVGALLSREVRADVGRVIDASDSKPLGDVDVVTTWFGQVYQIVQSAGTCFHLDLVRTDSEGGYERAVSPPAPRNIVLLYDIRSTVFVYRKGYKAVEPLSGRHLRMQRDVSSPPERMRYVARLADDMRCASQEEQKALIPVFERMYEEMSTITSRSADELVWLNAIQYDIDEIELGLVVARKRWNERKKAWAVR